MREFKVIIEIFKKAFLEQIKHNIDTGITSSFENDDYEFNTNQVFRRNDTSEQFYDKEKTVDLSVEEIDLLKSMDLRLNGLKLDKDLNNLLRMKATDYILLKQLEIRLSFSYLEKRQLIEKLDKLIEEGDIKKIKQGFSRYKEYGTI